MRLISSSKTVSASAAILIFLLTFAACGEQEAASRSPRLENLESLEQFEELFNHDRGVPRIVLLLSPT